MFATVYNEGGLSPQREPALTLQKYDDQNLSPAIQVYLPHNLTSQEFLRLFPSASSDKAAFTFPALHKWLTRTLRNFKLQESEEHTFHKHPYRLREIDVQAVDWFSKNQSGHDGRLGFMKIQAKIETDSYLHNEEKEQRSDWLAGAVFLRGGSAAVLIIVQPADATGENEKHVILTVQPRIAAGSLAFTEIPAGMLDDNSFTGTAANEIEEEASLKVRESDLINMTELAVAAQDEASATITTPSPGSELLEKAMYPSVGACDEFIPLFLCQKRLTRQHMNWLKGKATGLRDEGEKITLKLVPVSQAWREAARDAKALSALALYENLGREGKIPAMPSEVEPEPQG